MIADLKPYPEYKDSGLPWLGQVPGHWETRPAFGAFIPNQERNRGMKEKTVLSLSYGRIVIKPAEKLHGLVPESFETYQIVNPGDIVLRTTDLQNDHASLRVGMVRDRGIITSAYLALKVNAGVNPDFGFQFLNVWDTSKAIYGFGSGLRQNLDFSHFKRMPVALPPPAEQAAIVRFLDYWNGRLEKAIRAKRKIIALLNEQKQAIIHRAVTRGLDPNVKLKDSGIPWLGQIPEHWEVVQLRRVSRKVKTGGTPKGADERYYANGGFNWYTPSDFSEAIELANANRQLSEQGKDQVTIFPTNTILMIGIGATIGKVSISRFACSCNQQINAILPNPKLSHLEYLAYYLRTLRQYIFDCGKFTTMPILNQDGTKMLPVLRPPLDEQIAIAKHVESMSKPFATTITRYEREIELLREYRTRLTADVVTGKLDVCEAVHGLPVVVEGVSDESDLSDLSDEEADTGGEEVEA